MGSGKRSLTLSPRLLASRSSIQSQTRVCASYSTQASQGQTGRQSWPRSPRRAVPTNSESRGPHLVLTQQEPLSGPGVEKTEGLGEPQNRNPSPMCPPLSGEQKQRFQRATGSHLPLPPATRVSGELRTVPAPWAARSPEEGDCSRREGGRREGIRAPGCRARGGVPPPES